MHATKTTPSKMTASGQLLTLADMIALDTLSQPLGAADRFLAPTDIPARLYRLGMVEDRWRTGGHGTAPALTALGEQAAREMAL